METDTPVELPSVNTSSLDMTSIMKWFILIFGALTIGLIIYHNYYSSKNVEDTVSTDLDASVDEVEQVGENAGQDLGTEIDDLSKEIGSGVENVGKGVENVISEVGSSLDIHVKNRNNVDPISDTNDSSIQMPKKTGYCYIGEDRGARSCMYVGKRDTCMSGDIFPSMDICINPNLRA